MGNWADKTGVRRSLAQRMRADDGIAMVLVLISVVAVTVMGAALVVAGTRDLDSSTSVQRATSALGIAEAGVQHAVQNIKVLGPSRAELHKLVTDQSDDISTPGQGRWMSADGQCPPLDDQVERWIGTGEYKVCIKEINRIDLAGGIKEGVYQVIATGVDRRDNPARPGARTVEQFLRVRSVDVPFALFAKNGVDFGGTPQVLSESLYTTGDVKWRSKVTVQGTDAFYKDPVTGDPLPAGVHATGVIYEGNASGGGSNGPIHPPNANCKFPYDRDKRGGSPLNYSSCNPAVSPTPPWSSSFFDEAILESLGINKNGPSEDAYQFLKALAKSTNTYFVHTANSTFVVNPPGSPTPPLPAGLPSFFVIYVDVAPGATGEVAVKTGWGPAVPNPPPDPWTASFCPPPADGNPYPGTYKGHFGIVVVRNGSVSWQNNESWWGSVFVPEGEFGGSGSGTAWIVGNVYSKTIGNTGNVRFQLNDCWLNRAVGPFFIVERLRWHEKDRP